LCLVAVGHKSSQEHLAGGDITAKLESSFITFLLPHLGYSIASPLRINVSKFSPHSAQVNSNIGIGASYFAILQKVTQTVLHHKLLQEKVITYLLNVVRFL
jgi:hypothetical protein